GSLMWTCVSTSPGRIAHSPMSSTGQPAGTWSGATTPAIRSPRTSTAASPGPAGVTTTLLRIAPSAPLAAPPRRGSLHPAPPPSLESSEAPPMPAVLTHHSYGKSQVRLTRVHRAAGRHDLKELCVAIQLEGDFAGSYTHGDNSRIVATDTMKNVVYAL